MYPKNELLSVNDVSEDIETFLKRIGDIFKVFDKQDSGCISYGVAVEGTKLFVKYSGRKEAIERLKNAEAFNRAVSSEVMPALRNSLRTKDGYALVFDWVNGEVLSSPDFPGPEGKNNPLSPHFRFRQLPPHKIIQALNAVYSLHSEIESKGYVAVDFYAGSMIYDFDTDEVHCCDFDHYASGPFILEQERLPGSRSLMAPEEFCKGSVIDHRTNVFTMGALAFMFLGNGVRSADQWRASDSLLHVAIKAVSPIKEERYASVNHFYSEWKRALAEEAV
ncbi:serine/threonine protein kinase [Paenibacillus thermotolerans]|uniref:serine/threonine protein kinase n=1 Tax=Paenibacillus thermotolerans TaxID=3027807 RepID=UPI002367E36F|nr:MULTISPECIES: serine/threonine protein kinase [unclassified Paenibacillus]